MTIISLLLVSLNVYDFGKDAKLIILYPSGALYSTFTVWFGLPVSVSAFNSFWPSTYLIWIVCLVTGFSGRSLAIFTVISWLPVLANVTCVGNWLPSILWYPSGTL